MSVCARACVRAGGSPVLLSGCAGEAANSSGAHEPDFFTRVKPASFKLHERDTESALLF